MVDLLAGMAITGMLLPVTMSSMFHTFTVTESSRSKVTALENIEYAANRLRDDVHKAQTTDLVDGGASVSSLNLSWIDGTTGQSHLVSYYLSNTLLQRDYDGITSTVGRYITSIDFSLSNGVIKVKIISSPGINSSSSLELTYSLALP